MSLIYQRCEASFCLRVTLAKANFERLAFAPGFFFQSLRSSCFFFGDSSVPRFCSCSLTSVQTVFSPVWPAWHWILLGTLLQLLVPPRERLSLEKLLLYIRSIIDSCLHQPSLAHLLHSLASFLYWYCSIIGFCFQTEKSNSKSTLTELRFCLEVWKNPGICNCSLKIRKWNLN